MVCHSAVIYKSGSGNKIRLRGCVEMDLLNITINYTVVKGKNYLFSWQRGKQRLLVVLNGFTDIFHLSNLRKKGREKKNKENIDFQLKDTNVYITTEAINFLTYGEQQEQQRHRSFTTHCRH